MGVIARVIDVIRDLLKEPVVVQQDDLVRCPFCNNNLWHKNLELRVDIDRDLTFVRCVCGHPSAWFVNGHGPQLIYTDQPLEDEVFDDDE